MIHAEALEALLAARVPRLLKRDLCDDAQVSPGFLSDLLAHRCGAAEDVAERIAGSLGVNPAAIFPEIAGWVSPLPDRDARREVAA
jgi:hypothetical protein